LLKQQNNYWQLTWSSATQPLFTDGSETITTHQWQQKLLAINHYIASQQANNVLLYQSDSLWFSLWFVALCQAGKHIVLAPDNQPDTVAMAAAYCDWQAPETFTAVTGQDSAAVAPSLHLLSSSRVSFFTSGSTGAPKLITKQLSQLLLEVQTLQAQFAGQFAGPVLFAATVSYQHIYGLLFRMLWPLCFGHVQHRLQLSYLEQWQVLLQRQPVVLVASPAHLARFDDIATLAGVADNSAQVFSSGGPLADEVPRRYAAALGQAPTEVFGSTETGGIAYRQRNCANTAWQVFDSVRISQDNQQALRVSSPYLDTEGFFTTADQVELLSEQCFRLLGRLDRIVKIEEKRLALPEVEQHCLNSEYVTQAVALVLRQTKAQLVLVVVLSACGEQLLQTQGKLAVNQQLKQHLLQRFERVMLPRKFRYVAALPYNQQGKLPLQQLEALFNHD